MAKTIAVSLVGAATKSVITENDKRLIKYDGKITSQSANSITILFPDGYVGIFEYEEFINTFGQANATDLADYLKTNNFFVDASRDGGSTGGSGTGVDVTTENNVGYVYVRGKEIGALYDYRFHSDGKLLHVERFDADQPDVGDHHHGDGWHEIHTFGSSSSSDEFVINQTHGKLSVEWGDKRYSVAHLSNSAPGIVLGHPEGRITLANSSEVLDMHPINGAPEWKILQPEQSQSGVAKAGEPFIVEFEVTEDRFDYGTAIELNTAGAHFRWEVFLIDGDGEVIRKLNESEPYSTWRDGDGYKTVVGRNELFHTNPVPLAKGRKVRYVTYVNIDTEYLGFDYGDGNVLPYYEMYTQPAAMEKVATREWITKAIVGVSASEVDYTVNTYPDLPPAPVDQNGNGVILARVEESTGLLWARKKAGYYKWLDSKWVYQSAGYNIPQATSEELESGSSDNEIRRFSVDDLSSIKDIIMGYFDVGDTNGTAGYDAFYTDSFHTTEKRITPPIGQDLC